MTAALWWPLGCGKQGPPLPPLHFIPAPTRDLAIHQQGTELIFSFAYPATTVAGGPLPGVEAVEIWELVAPQPVGASPEVDPQVFGQASSRLLTVRGAELAAATTGDRLELRIALNEPLPAEPELHVFGVRTVSSSRETSSFSNLVQLLLLEPLDPPRSLRVAPRANGIELAWRDEAEETVGYHVYRRPARLRSYGPPLVRLAPGERRYLDETAAYGTRYIYTVRALASEDPLIESAPAGEQEIDYQDRFPPEPPVGLLVLSESGRIRLAWEPSPDADTVGYHIHRRDPGGSLRRITDEPVASLEYLDQGLAPGLVYEYRVLAVDDAGNEGELGSTVSGAPQ